MIRTLHIATLFFSLLLLHPAYTQDTLDIDSTVKKNALSFGYLGTSTIMGVSYDRIIAKRISVEIGVGLVGAGIGVKYYHTKIKTEKVLFVTGLGVAASPYFNDTDVRFVTGNGFIVYLPIGISYFGKKRLNFGVDIGPASTFVENNSGTIFSIYGNIKVGFRF